MKKNNGFTLIEVLVAVVVLAVGLLGLAALQTTTLSNNQSAYFRSMATQFAYDISDRMRSNEAGVTAGNYNNGAAADANNHCTTNNCSAAQMAGVDLLEWNTTLRQLPGGVGIVCLDATPNDVVATAAAPACSNTGSVYAVKIWWDDTKSGNASQRFVMSFQP